MRICLHLTNWSLLSITLLIFSCFLLITDNSNYVAATHIPATQQQAITNAAFKNAGELSVEVKNDIDKNVVGIEPSNIKQKDDVDQSYRLSAVEQKQNIMPEVLGTDAAKTTHKHNAEKQNIDFQQHLAHNADDAVIGNINKNLAPGASLEGEKKTQTIDAIHNNLDSSAPNKINKDVNIKKELNNMQETYKHVVVQTPEKECSKEQKNDEEQPLEDKSVHVDNHDKSLPDLTMLPKVTITNLPLELLDPMREKDTGLLFKNEDEKNRTLDSPENSNEALSKDEQIIKINDSGGGAQLSADDMPEVVPPNNEIENNINLVNITAQATVPLIPTVEQPQQQHQENSNGSVTLNLTSEEVPIPVFSEWAQKQMEAAEKQEALLQQEVVNNSSQKRNQTNGNGKALPPLKIRAKNYASPDCGAKIISSNADASNTGAVLSSSKDEYMLSPCGNRIWFVVELCEAIQARRIELANFELFSSSPKNFSVAVSNRFPTREWSNVGRFVAEDKRTVQSFDLHPHLFGKFVRVDIHSHYSKEHFCPVSLFRVLGTSEFEAFETENQPEEIDDLDEEFALEQAHVKAQEQNLFKSASDAVISIVKKAAEVLVKPAAGENQSLSNLPATMYCRSSVLEQFRCAECEVQLIENINNVILGKSGLLNSILREPRVRQDLLNTMVCHKYGISFNNGASYKSQSYYAAFLPTEYVGALCQLLGSEELKFKMLKSQENQTLLEAEQERQDKREEDLPLNLTLGKKRSNAEFQLPDNDGRLRHHKKPNVAEQLTTQSKIDIESGKTNELPKISITKSSVEDESSEELESQISAPPITSRTPADDTSNSAINLEDSADTTKDSTPDVNIYNAVPEIPDHNTVANVETSTEVTSTEDNLYISGGISTPSSSSTEINSAGTAAKSEEDTVSWDSIDNLISATVASTTADSTPPLQKVPSSPQSESVFIRLSNRIKALERNMSLSGQYLEELSRRYKKQVEELQQALLQQTKIVRLLEDQNTLHNNMDQLNEARSEQLQMELNDLSMQFHACVVVIVCASFFFFLLMISGLILYRSLRRQTRELIALHKSTTTLRLNINNSSHNKNKLHRRKSCDDASDHQRSSSNASNKAKKLRRPSEEALIILKDSDTNNRSTGHDMIKNKAHNVDKNLRRRKISVCYGSHEHLISAQNKNKSNNRRKGAKLSLPANLQPWQRMEESEIVLPLKNNGGKKSQVALNMTAPAKLSSKNADYDESLNLEDDDLDNFLPNADLAYNEFMPEGPSGYLLVDNAHDNSSEAFKNNNNNVVKSVSSKDKKKTRRLSSPNFFKSAFGKSSNKSKSNLSGSGKSTKNTPHESTSWEWYRSKNKNEAQHQQQLQPHEQQQVHKLLPSKNSNTTGSLDSSSLSEINFPTSSTENSFRILEEAILSSGETLSGNGNVNGVSSLGSNSSGSSSQRSSSTSSGTAKKKSRSFNRILRKVF